VRCSSGAIGVLVFEQEIKSGPRGVIATHHFRNWLRTRRETRRSKAGRRKGGKAGRSKAEGSEGGSSHLQALRPFTLLAFPPSAFRPSSEYGPVSWETRRFPVSETLPIF
jgi:hypothetical protein